MFMTSLMIFYISLVFIHLTSPLSMGISIIALTIPVSLMIILILPSSWFSFLLAMIFLSAMMIIFVYVSSLAANEISFAASDLMIIPALMILMSTSHDNQTQFSTNTIDLLQTPTQFNLLYKMYTYNLTILTVFLMLYLLLALVVVVKNSSMKKTPFRMT